MPSFRDLLARTRNSAFSQFNNVFVQSGITDETWEELEAVLLQADVGVSTTAKLIGKLKQRVNAEGIKRADKLKDALKGEMVALLSNTVIGAEYYRPSRLLEVIMIIGVNGSGKTTSIAKLTQVFTKHGRKVILAAADTFRAAAIDQLQVWGERAGVPVIAGDPNSDPGAVAYNAVQAAYARKMDTLIVDTAGRLHTKHNLMQELKKIHNVLNRSVHLAPHQTLLVIDATNGQNAIAQAKGFATTVGITGAIITKLDGTPKGGVALSITGDLNVPILFVGTGEKIDTIREFNAKEFVDDLFD
jgi:fused signal recognition particle receptor